VLKVFRRPTILAILCLGVTCASGQTPTANYLPVARDFVRGLTQDPAKDTVAFQSVGRAPAQAMLMQVFNQGMAPSASLDDWADLHLALSGLMEFHAEQSDPNELYQASIFAGMQDYAYRDHEGNYARALEAAQASLELAQRSGLIQTIYTNWANAGRDLLSLGRIDEAVADLRKARDLIPPTYLYSNNAAHVWRDLVSAELAGQNLAVVSDEVDSFLQTAALATPFFRAEAQLANADLKMAKGKYGEVPTIVSAAMKLVVDPLERATFGYEA